MVAHLICREAEHQHNLLCASGNSLQADRKAVAAQNREDYADGLAAQLCADICRNIINVSVVALCASYYCLCYCYYILVVKIKSLAAACCQNRIHYDFCQIVPFTDDGCAHAAGYSTYQSFHNKNPLFSQSKFFFPKPSGCSRNSPLLRTYSSIIIELTI